MKNKDIDQNVECICTCRKYKTVLVRPLKHGSSTYSQRARASRRRLVLVYYFAMTLTLRDFNASVLGKDKLLYPKPGF